VKHVIETTGTMINTFHTQLLIIK